MELSENMAFQAYAVNCVLWVINLMALGIVTSASRARSRQTLNPEDAKRGKTLVEAEPPAAARALRAHRNAMENILPFMVLGLIYVLLDATPLAAWAYFGTFSVARVVHSVAYLREFQPWRSIGYGFSTLATLGLMVSVLWRALV